MDKPIIPNLYTSPLYTQHYERYLPTAFDESLTLLQKVNKVIVDLNQLGKLSNDTMDQWNTVMDWVMNDGLDGSIDAKLDALQADGTLASIINEAIFDELNTRVTNVESKNTAQDTHLTTLDTSISDLQTDIDVNTNQIGWLGVSVKSLGAKGDYVSDTNRGTDDTTVFQNALNQGGIIVVPEGNYYITLALTLKSNTRLIFSPKAVIHTYADKGFLLGLSVTNVRIEQANLVNHYIGTSFAYYLSGDYSSGYGSTVNNIIIDGGTPTGYTWAIYMNNARKVNISNLATSTRNGVQYVGRSAECVIDQCNFIQFDDASNGATKGLYAYATSDGYPEGLAVSKSLFYHYERNIHMTDMYSGHFSHLYLDGGVTGCLPNLLTYNQRFQFNTFDDIWCLGNGWTLGDDSYASPKEFRSTFNNITLDAIHTNGFELKPWVRCCEFNHIDCYGDGVATIVAFVLRNWNDFFRLTGYTGRFTAGTIQVYGNGGHVECWATSNFDDLTNNGVYNEHAITFNGVGM